MKGCIGVAIKQKLRRGEKYRNDKQPNSVTGEENSARKCKRSRI